MLPAVLAALALCAPAAPPREPAALPALPFTRTVLGNGLTLLVHEDHKAPVVAVSVWYHVGSKDERPGRTGFAHLFEHLMFGRSAHRSEDALPWLERLGATDANGTTSEDRTNYYETVPAPALDAALFLESERMGHLLPALDQAKLDEQRGVVLNEKRESENQPYGRVEALLARSCFPAGHPYSWSPIGSEEDLRAATLEDVRAWFTTWYGPSNAVLAIAGDVDPAEVRRKVERWFGDLPPGPPLARAEASVVRRNGTSRAALQDRVAHARLLLTWNTARLADPDDVDLELAARVLSAGKSARLYRRLVYDGRLAHDVSASQDGRELAGLFQIDATVRDGVAPGRVEAAARDELRRFLAGGPTAAELDRVRAELLAGVLRGLERVGGLGGKADLLAEGEVLLGRADAFRERLALLRSATPARVRAAARRWLADGDFALTVTPFPPLAAGAGGADRSRPPEVGAPLPPAFPAFTRHRLSNGLAVIVAERHALPLVDVALVADAGYASDQGGVPGTARLAGAMIGEGTRRRTAVQISDEAQRLGAVLGAFSDLDQTTASISAPRERLGEALALFADVVLHPSFPAADFERERGLQLAAIEEERLDPHAAGLRILPGLLYGPGHPYGAPLTGSGTPAGVAGLRREDVARWHATWIRPGSSTLVVVGDVTPAELLPRLERLLGGWAPGAAPRKALPPLPPARRGGLYLVDRPGAPQSVLLAGAVVTPRANPRELAEAAWNDVLGANFGSRLNLNLREARHWSYGAYSGLVDARGPRPFLVYAPVQTDRTAEALAELRRELAEIRGARPPSAEEVAAVKARRTAALPGSWETLGMVSAALARLLRFGFPDGYHAELPRRLAALTPEEVRDAGAMVDPAEVAWVVVGDRAQVEAGLSALGLGPPVLLDADGRPAR